MGRSKGVIGKGLETSAESGAKFGELINENLILCFGGAGVWKVW